jgi:hypothetical protein
MRRLVLLLAPMMAAAACKSGEHAAGKSVVAMNKTTAAEDAPAQQASAAPTASPGPASSRSPSASAPSALRLTRDGLGPLRVGMPIDRDALVRLAPGHSVAVVDNETEGEAYQVFEIRSGDATLVRVTPADGKISSITILSSSIPSDIGVAPSARYPAVRDALGPLDCELTDRDDLFPEQPTCTSKQAQGLHIIFQRVDLPDLDEGARIPPDRQNALLGDAAVEAIDLR